VDTRVSIFKLRKQFVHVNKQDRVYSRDRFCIVFKFSSTNGLNPVYDQAVTLRMGTDNSLHS